VADQRQVPGDQLLLAEGLAEGLAECRNTVLLPHLGSATHATRAAMARMAAENVVAALRDRRPPNLVNPEIWPDAPANPPSS